MTGSFLSDRELADAAVLGTAFADPFDAASVQPASIDLRISNECYEYTFESCTIGEKVDDDAVKHRTYEEIWLNPGESAYVGLAEKLNIPDDIIGFVFPRSTLTRLGVSIYPVYMNPGYRGTMPVTITNNGRVKVRIVPGVRVAQLICAKLSGPVLTGYGDQPAAKYYDERMASAKEDEENFAEALQRVLRARMPQLANP